MSTKPNHCICGFPSGDNTNNCERCQLFARIRELEGGFDRRTPGTGPWRCFHCDEKFIDAADAASHFGPTEHSRLVCQTEAEYIRKLEAELRTYRNEDTDLHREIAAMSSSHQVELRREEEKGYARGLRDANHVETKTP